MVIKEEEKPMKNKGRLIAGAIFLTPILMLILSTTLYYSGYSPEGTTNKGELIEPPLEVQKIKLKAKSGPLENEFPGKWTIVIFLNDECSPSCWDSLYKTRQVNVRLSRDSSRLNRYLVLKEGVELPKAQEEKLLKEYPALLRGTIQAEGNESLFIEGYYLFDPIGNGIIYYSPELPGGELLEDIKKLLRNSKIG